jgi:hypothetical protein
MNWNELTKTDDAKALVPKLSPSAQITLKYLGGDYWQNMDAWAGTRPPLDAGNREVVEAELARMFVPQPLIEEATRRHADGVVGHEPAFEYVLSRALQEDEEPTPTESADLEESNAAVGAWWDARDGHETLGEFTSQLISTGRAALRVFVPSGLLSEDGRLLQSKDWKSALDAIYLECPAPESAAVHVDRATMRPLSIFVYKETVTREGKEVEVERVEISFVDERGQTVIRILEEDVIIEGGEAIQDLGGELYVDTAELPPLISPAAHKLQNALNVINSMILKNGDLAGFRERNYINLQRPKKSVPAPTEADPNATVLEDADVEVGADAANFLVGVTYKDVDGNPKMATGSVVISDPVSPEPLITAAERFERGFYQAVSQLHVLISGDATASAVSRVQARADFVQSLLKTKPKIEGVLRSRLRAVLLLAAFLADDKEHLKRFKELRVRVDCRLDPGPMTPDEKRALLELHEGGMISRETAQTLLGIEDLDGEQQKLQNEQESSQEWKKNQATIAQLWSAAGAGVEEAAIEAGVDAERAAAMARSDFVEGASDGE